MTKQQERLNELCERADDIAEQEAIDNICTKIARIVNRKSLYDLDSWQDIAGYATLVVNLIKEQEARNEAK